MGQEPLFKTKGEVFLRGQISEERAEKFISFLERALLDETPEVTVHIDSDGGVSTAAIKAYDALRRISAKKPVVGMVVRRAHSAAALVLQGCDRRVAHVGASIMIHDVRVIFSALVPEVERIVVSGDLLRNVKMWKFNQQKMDYIFAERTGRAIEEVRAKCAEGKCMDSFSAKEFGLIDEVV